MDLGQAARVAPPSAAAWTMKAPGLAGARRVVGGRVRMAVTLPGGVKWSDVIIIAAATVLGVLASVGFGVVVGSNYASTALVNGGPGSSASLPLNLSSDVTQRYVATELIYIDTLADQMAANMEKVPGVTSPPPVQANQDGSTNVIKMTVVGETPDQAAALATVAADTYIRNWRERTRLDPDREELASVKSDRYVQRPTPQNATKTMGMTSLALLGAVLGFGIGVVVTYLRVRHREAAHA